jgi:pimeloyl-ACP methyl ester carboxylesterase
VAAPHRVIIRTVLIAAFILFLTPAAWNLAATKYQHARNPVPGAFYDIEGRRMHIYCSGSGPYTVVIEVGASADSDSWRGIQDTLSQKTRICTYDRNGHGWSEPSPGPHDANTIARKLHALLDKAAVGRPLILAGHSAGGLYIRAYARQFPKEIVGAVMIDSSSPTQIDELPDWRNDWEQDVRKLPAERWKDRLKVWSGWDRLIGNCHDAPSKELKNLAAEYDAETCRPEFAGEEDNELPYFEDSSTEAARLTTFGNIPLLIITRDTQRGKQKDDMIWDREQEQFKSLSPLSWRIIAKGAGHGVHHDRPEIVTTEIGDMIAYLQNGPNPPFGTTSVR